MALATGTSVQSSRGRRLFRRDEPHAEKLGGDSIRTCGRPVSFGPIYVGIALIVAGACFVDTFSLAHDMARRGANYNFWLPLLWETTSGAVIIALLPLPRGGAILATTVLIRPAMAVVAIPALALAFSAFHILGMVLLRKLAYAVGGGTYTFNWSIAEVAYELRKDLFSFITIAITFWLAERAFGAAGRGATTSNDNDGATTNPEGPAQQQSSSTIWLRDGRTSILVDPQEILWVASAENYVEYALTGGRRHLIRTTLKAEEARLSSFGIARVHRARLINLKRIVAIAWGSFSDFELRLDTGETIIGSRRYKTAIAGIGR
jgi:hypothetical protein